MIVSSVAVIILFSFVVQAHPSKLTNEQVGSPPESDFKVIEKPKKKLLDRSFKTVPRRP